MKIKSMSKFAVILSAMLLINAPTYSKEQLQEMQSEANDSPWNTCQKSSNKFLCALKESVPYWLPSFAQTLMVMRFYSGTVEGARENSRKHINSYKNANIFWQLLGISSLHRAYFIERLNDEQLKKFLSVEKGVLALGLGVLSFGIYSMYKSLKSVDFYSFWQYLQILKGRKEKALVILGVDQEGNIKIERGPIFFVPEDSRIENTKKDLEK